jgi:hypothetical protein
MTVFFGHGTDFRPRDVHFFMLKRSMPDDSFSVHSNQFL